MVLPRDVPAPVWGWTTPGAKVTVSIAGKNVVATADENGRWLAKVGPFPASDKGQTLTITGPQTVTIENVVVGDVWFCAGQSNMYMLVKDASGDFPVVSSPQVAVPVAVRYACDDSPVANLVNKTGLPAAPFRTDSW